ncbi:MAG: DUF262 domain-containing protein [Muribaculaceae bacterium]|nr:DUF262 domain-containing protein [Muribaculaceae bacterium]
MSATLELKCIKQILDYNFFIPDYQRGYRWSEQQVRELLEDLTEFACKKRADYEFYCLQPLAVREMTQEDKLKTPGLTCDEKWMEVIDGQQRLTTLYMILREMADDFKYEPKGNFRLKYCRATDIDRILDDFDETGKVCTDNIDTFYITGARKFIRDWFKTLDGTRRRRLISAILDYDPEEEDDENHPGSMNRDRGCNIRFIWYEAADEKPIEIFTRLNIGRISLTNSELIKAMILNRKNFKGKTVNDHIRLRQQEIASEWDDIERTLRNSEFSAFLNAGNELSDTRIDLIFNLIVEENKLNLSDKKLEGIGHDRYRTFRYFYCYFTEGKGNIGDCWDVVKDYYQTFTDWFEDTETYHYIGYLTECGKANLNSLVNKWSQAQDKHEFKRQLKIDVGKVLGGCPGLEHQFRTDGNDKGLCKPILLFHNVQTAINQSTVKKDDQQPVFYRFPFHLYRREKWDVEHINSNTTNPETDLSTQGEWLMNIYLSVDKPTQQQIHEFFVCSEERKGDIFNMIRSRYAENDDWTPEEKNRIWNYALLDSTTNRGYGNAIFSAKRRIIIGKERGEKIYLPEIEDSKLGEVRMEKAESCFVPVCTKQVFLKYYSPVSDRPNYWTKEMDAPGYLDDIRRCIAQLEEKNADSSAQPNQ